jgi:hypothetical protein
MRIIKTCIVKLVVDSDDPKSLRGKLHLVESDDEFAFKDEQSLLKLLKQISQTPSNGTDYLYGLDIKEEV